MGVVDEQVTSQRTRGEVVNAARAVCDIAHDQGGGVRAEAREDVGDGGGEEEQTLGELQGDVPGARRSDTVDAFVDFEVVVGREESDGGVDVWVMQDGVGDRVQRAGSTAWLGNCSFEIELELDIAREDIGRLTPCIADASSMLAFASAPLPASVAVFLPTKRRLGCLGTAGTSSGTPSSAAGPRFVCARSSSIFPLVVVLVEIFFA